LKLSKKLKATGGKAGFDKGMNVHNINHSSGLSSIHGLSKIDYLTNENSLKAEPSGDAQLL
jgi:hypothetical protein